MKSRLKVSLWIGVILAVLTLMSKAFGLMNMPSDMAVIGGIATLLLLFIFVPPIVKWALNKIENAGKKPEKGGNVGNLRSFVIVFALISVTILSGCERIGPGHVGIKINMSGTYRGVEDVPQVTGWVFYLPWATSILDYPTFVHTAVWTKSPDEGKATNEEITFNTKEGTNVSGDISLSYSLIPEKVPHFYVKFRSDDLDLFTHGFLRNIARDAFNETAASYTLEEVYGVKKEEYLTKVRDRVNKEVNGFGVKIEQFGFTGSLRMDPIIMTALNNKLKAIQDAIAAENKLREITAVATQKVAAAEGDAKANELLARSLTPQLMQWRQLQITEAAVARWNGQRPYVEGGTSGMLLQLPMPQGSPVQAHEKKADAGEDTKGELAKLLAEKLKK